MKVRGNGDTCHHQSRAGIFGVRRRQSVHSSHCGSLHHLCRNGHRTSPHFLAFCSHLFLCKKAAHLTEYHSSDSMGHRLNTNYNRLRVREPSDRSYLQSERDTVGTRLQSAVHSTNWHNPHPSYTSYLHIYSSFRRRYKACAAGTSFLELKVFSSHQ